MSRIRNLLTDFQSELNQSEAQFAAWRSEWDEREEAIWGQLDEIGRRLGRPCGIRPTFNVVSLDQAER
ncbi:MAG: hypothetical protein R3C01_05880 [Planctomycetaceae bacterium]